MASARTDPGVLPQRQVRTFGQGPGCRGGLERPGRGAADPGGVAVAENSDDFGHVPVLLQRCVELLTPALTRRHSDGSGAVLVDATLGAGGHAERFLTELPGLRLIGLDRDPSALDIARARLAPIRRPGHAGAHALRRPRRRADRIRLCRNRIGRRGAVRPRRLLHAARPRRAGLRLRPGRAAGHADGPGVTADRGRHPQHLRRGRAGGHPAPLRRGAVRAPHRQRRSSASAPAPRSPRPRSWSSCSTKRFRRRPGAPADIRPSAPSRRCGSRSTTS